jgi:sterol desaturase/sphingolipid hydroxylase (fatty acid hydroxylase superfamily)
MFEKIRSALSDWRILSPVIIVIASQVFIALERKFPYDARQKVFRKGWFNDFFYYTLVQSYFLGLVIFGFIGWLDNHAAGRFRLVAGWPMWAQILFFLVTHDFYIYCFHRLMHKNRFLWRLHEAHHSVENIDWLAGSRSHILEIVINQTIEFAPIIILGAPPEMVQIKGTIDALWGMYIHSNINVRSGFLQYIINGPEMHRWHHSIEYIGDGMNYGTKFAFWDWIFGTAYLPDRKPPGYGVADVQFPEELPHAPEYEGKTAAVGTSFIPHSIRGLFSLVFTELKNYWTQQFFAFRRFESPAQSGGAQGAE